MDMRLCDVKVGDVSDVETLKLFDELGIVTGVKPVHWAEIMTSQYLHQCLFPNGGSNKPVKLDRRDIDDVDDFGDFVLLRKVRKTGDSLHQLLSSLIDPSQDHIDHHGGSAIYTFLNKRFAPVKKKPKIRYFRR